MTETKRPKPDVVTQMRQSFMDVLYEPRPTLTALEGVRYAQELQDRAMVAALSILQEVMFEQFDGHAEPSQALGILMARHENKDAV